MKKLFLFVLLAALLLPGVALATYNEGSAVHRIESSGGSAADPVRMYMLVRNPNNGQNDRSMTADDVVIWDILTDDGVTVNYQSKLNMDVISRECVAGVVVGTIPTTDNANAAASQVGLSNWGYIQTYGLGTCKMTGNQLGNWVSGDALIMSNVEPYATTEAPLQLGNRGKFGFAMDSGTQGTIGSNSNEVFIRCR